MDNSITRLLAEANQKNNPKRPLSLINVKPNAPEPLVGDERFNSKIKIDAVPGRTYVGTQTLLYKRIDISEALSDAQLRSVEPFTVQSVIDMVNRQFGLFLIEDDLEPFTPPSLALDESKSLTLVSKSGSFGFMGSVEIDLKYGRTLLESVVIIRLLPLFEHPDDPLKGIRSARMMTWGIDFTSLRDSIKVDPVTNSYADWATFQTACLYLGLPAWTQDTIVDKATTEVPDSNPAFDRVVVQANVSNVDITGPLYFHYNLLDEV